jgi:hypothetical protein
MMMQRWWWVSMMLAAAPAQDPFDAIRAGATEVESLQKLLLAFHPAPCSATDPVEKRACAQKEKASQEPFKGKPLYVSLGHGFDRLMEPLDAPGGRAAVLLTPIFDLGLGIALTFHRPLRVGKNGSITVPSYPLEDTLQDSELTPGELRRLLRTGQVALEVVGQVKGPWVLHANPRDPVRGVELQVKAVRLRHARTGRALLSHVTR